MAKQTDKIVTRQRCYWKEHEEAGLCTVLERGKLKSKIRTHFGFEEEVATKELDFNVNEEDATLTFRPPSS